METDTYCKGRESEKDRTKWRQTHKSTETEKETGQNGDKQIEARKQRRSLDKMETDT